MKPVLTINVGSSSIKFALFEQLQPAARSLHGAIERIGLAGTVIRWKRANEPFIAEEPFAAEGLEQAGERLIVWLDTQCDLAAVGGVGHRVVHGGPRYCRAERITPEVLDELRRIEPIDPDHLPGEIALIEIFLRRLPGVPQVACFDTAFHHDMPEVARLLPVPRHYQALGARRYGFHGLSYTYLMGELARIAGPEVADGRVLLAHLGSGASMAAVQNGRSVDTTMSLTPTAGLVMSTRSGDLDPGFLLYLMRHERMSAQQIDDLVNRESGLLGVSGISPNMKDLLDREASDRGAAAAVELFCYSARKHAAAMVAAMGGLDTLVFAGGIGERSAAIRARICAGLEFLGVRIDPGRNSAHQPVISADTSRVSVRVVPTDEEITIARETAVTAFAERAPEPAPPEQRL
jgi:acetate kinase